MTAIPLCGQHIQVDFALNALRIINDNSLQELLVKGGKAATDELVSGIKKQYFQLFNIEFKVSDASMSVEIWAHVFADKFAESIKRISSINFIDKIAEIIIRHTEIIDMGEKGHDENRFVWDALAPFKAQISGLLFAKQQK